MASGQGNEESLSWIQGRDPRLNTADTAAQWRQRREDEDVMVKVSW